MNKKLLITIITLFSAVWCYASTIEVEEMYSSLLSEKDNYWCAENRTLTMKLHSATAIAERSTKLYLEVVPHEGSYQQRVKVTLNAPTMNAGETINKHYNLLSVLTANHFTQGKKYDIMVYDHEPSQSREAGWLQMCTIYYCKAKDLYHDLNWTRVYEYLWYSTIIMPADYDIPEGLNVWTVDKISEPETGYASIITTAANKISENTPYIVTCTNPEILQEKKFYLTDETTWSKGVYNSGGLLYGAIGTGQQEKDVAIMTFDNANVPLFTRPTDKNAGVALEDGKVYFKFSNCKDATKLVYVEHMVDVTVKGDDTKLGTFSSVFNIDFSNADDNDAMAAYTVNYDKGENDHVTVVRHKKTLPAKNGVLIYAPKATKTQKFKTVAKTSDTVDANNKLIASPISSSLGQLHETRYNYIISDDAFIVVPIEGMQIGGGDAYLSIERDPSLNDSKPLTIQFDVPTDIEERLVIENAKGEERTYNLQGQEIKCPHAGHIYIRNGKKVIVR